MLASTVLALAAVVPHAALALPAAPVAPQIQQRGLNSTQDACAKIAQAYAGAKNPNRVSFDGRLALDCLMSTPFEGDKAADFATSLKKFFQFQSTIDILKDPPAGYSNPAVDILGGMDDIIQQAKNNGFLSHYAFETAILDLIAKANDGHLSLGGLCSQSFIFSRSQGLVSLSEDGVEIPDLYIDSDARLIALGSDATISPVESIMGMPAATYLEGFASTLGFHDPDARYNSLFKNAASNASIGGAIGGTLIAGNTWPGTDSLELMFANGSIMSLPTLASFNDGPFNFTSGKSFYENVCLNTPAPTPTNSSSSTPLAPVQTSTLLPSNYPRPIFSVPDNLIAGFYPEDMNDTAVLLIPNFQPPGDEEQSTEIASIFINQTQDFLMKAPKAGKTRLIIDVTGNPGGLTILGYNLYSLLFPHKPILGYVNFRAHTAARVLTELTSNIDATGVFNFSIERPEFDAFQAVSPDQKTPFTSFGELYGPFPGLDTNVTAIQAPINFTSNDIEGFDPRVPDTLPSQPFQAQNILVVSDGQCTSTCNILLTLLRHEAGVKTLALGGRPQTGLMTPSGGAKGAEVMEYSWTENFEQTLALAKGNTTLLSTADFQTALDTVPPTVENLPFVLGVSEVNFYNNFVESDQTTPLQFVFEPAECRLFYTADMWFLPEKAWKAAADAWWGNGACVKDSVPHPS